MSLPSPDEGGQLLYQAALYDNVELLRDLLSGEFVHQLDWRDGHGRTALHAAAASGHVKCVKVLLEAGAEVNVASGALDNYRTPLQAAAESGHTKAVQALTQAGADVFAQDKNGYCALELAQMAGKQETSCALLDAIELGNALLDDDEKEVEFILSHTGRQFLSEVINGSQDEEYTMLYKAAELGRLEIVKILLKHQADGRIHPVTQYSPLYIAAFAGHFDVVEVLLKNFPELVQVQTFEEWLPFHAVCKAGDKRIMKLLLSFPYPDYIVQSFTDSSGKWSYKFAFDVNCQDTECRSPLYMACEEGHEDIVKMLLDFTVEAVSCQESPRHIASPEREAAFEEVVFREKAVRNNSESSGDAGDTPVKKAKSRLNVLPVKQDASELRSPDGAVKRKRMKFYTPLIVDTYSKFGRTPLQVAAAGGFQGILRLLIERGGASVNLPLAITDEELATLNPVGGEILCAGSGALMEACRKGDAELVDLLIGYGASDHENRALSDCIDHGFETIACKLLCRQVFLDPEFRINKKGVEAEAQLGRGRTVVPSSLYPSMASMLNWHRAGLRVIRDGWLFRASLELNPKMTSGVQSLILSSITRVDVSKNSLEELPFSLFQLPSLRILNAAHNQIKMFPLMAEEARRNFSGSHWHMPVLEEIHVEHNCIENVPDELFVSLPNLTALDVSNNRISAIPSSVWLAPKLKDLNLSHNLVSSLPSLLETEDRPQSATSDVSAMDIELDFPIGENRTNSVSGSVKSLASYGEDPLSAQLTDTTFGSDGSMRPSADENLSVQELKRHNLWQKSVELSKIIDEDEDPLVAKDRRKTRSCLTSLNVSHNHFERTPECLPCLAPALTRLNLSCNALTEIGPVMNYPPRLKHLDLSGNRIKSWFFGPRCNADLACYCSSKREGRSAHSPTMGRRSQSVARGQRSLSMASRNESGSLLTPSVTPSCPHKRHLRLDNLRTLVLSGNWLSRICLSLETSSATGGSPYQSQDSASGSQRPSKKSLNEVQLASSPSVESPVGSIENHRSRLVFPCLTMLDLSNNQLRHVIPSLSDLTALSVLNLAFNPGITSLPPELGLLVKLWNLNLNGCSLGEPLKTMLESKKYKTMDIVGYLKSILEDSKQYARMKLMLVGVQGIGKTSLLEQLRQEGTVTKKNPPEGWAKRMGNKNINQKTAKGTNISTVGVDIGDWTYEPKKSKNQQVFGPVTFRTWDFGGQREYYATHQYFLSRRSLYLVVWRVTDGDAGISEILQWLVNIQARAPNSPVLIVGTHFDEVLANNKKFPSSFVDDLQQVIRERFVAIQDADKKGFPRVIDSIVVSSKSRYNIRTLCNLIYSTAFDQRSTGSKERLLEQKIPASYLALEEIVCMLADQRKVKGKDPVITGDQYRTLVQDEMHQRFNKHFRDLAELNQATSFLHENGLLLHYEDATLKELYFLDPQWLCDILAHVITIREINPFAKNGLMRLDDLKVLFKSSRFSPTNIRSYILNLLQKFEVAMTWDNRHLLIPCLLPDEYHLRGGYKDGEVMIPVKSKGWTVPSASAAIDAVKFANPPLYDGASNTVENVVKKVPTPNSSSEYKEIIPPPIFSLPNRREGESLEPQKPNFSTHWEEMHEACVRRLYLMSYIPSGFWSRLMTRILGDEQILSVWDQIFQFSLNSDEQSSSVFEVKYGIGKLLSRVKGLFEDSPRKEELDFRWKDKGLKKIFDDNRPQWVLWQTGMEVRAFGELLFSLKEFLPLAQVRDANFSVLNWKCQLDGSWRQLKAESSSTVEIFIPAKHLTLRYPVAEKPEETRIMQLETDRRSQTRLLSIVVELIDTLLEDWYPSLGTRFVHTSEGKFLVTRLVPCPRCLAPYRNQASEKTDKDWTLVGFEVGSEIGENFWNRGKFAKSKTFDASTLTPEELENSARSLSEMELTQIDQQQTASQQGVMYSFTVEECILLAHEAKFAQCPAHGPLALQTLAPDTVFLDISGKHLILPDQVKRGKMIGRGAFGFVFRAQIKHKHAVFTDVALKMLQPVDPGFGARSSASTAYKAAWAKWQRDPSQYACRAYCTARQELNVLSHIKHPHIVPMVGVCPRPLALVVALAPLGGLNHLLQNYRRSGAKLHLTVLQETLAQVARGLEYLHQEHIIYRDLKSENVLVWQYPPPFSQITTVDVKLGDYGISRSVFPAGGAKGFGGTEGFMAPEIMRYNGEEEYTEKVDCFSYAMFLYELLSLKLPFEGQEQMKEFILDGGRPQLAPNELLYPCNVLDLMVVSWAQQPVDRPSASQLVSIATAPEFSHLMDVVSLNDSDAAVLVGEAFTLDENAHIEDSMPEGSLDGELWLSRADGQISVLSCNQHGWLDYKNIYVNEDSFVTAMCLVEDTVWLGELTGIVRVFCVKTYCELYSFPLAPHVLPNEESPKHQLSLAVSAILSLNTLRLVLVVTGQPGALLVCRMTDNLGGQGSGDPVISVNKIPLREVHCVTVLPTDKKGFVELWTGESSGFITVFSASGESLKQLRTVNHYSPQVDGVEVYRLVCSQSDGRYVWSYVFPGSILYQWNVSQKAIVAKLDCSKIIPCSESINTINIEEKLNPGRCQVSSMCLVEKDGGTQLYMGTTWGVVIVAEADQLKPITAFRTHLEDVRVIVPLDSGKRPVLFQDSPVKDRHSSTSASSIKWNQRTSSNSSNKLTPEKESNSRSKQSHPSPTKGNYVLTVGKGYRCLIQRFLDNYREEPSVLDSRNKDFFAIMWRTDDWIQ